MLMRKIPISVSCYNNEDEIILFAKMLKKQKNLENLVLLVTVNAAKSINKLTTQLKRIKIDSHIYEPQINLGYLHGCIYGLKKYGSRNDYDWAFISNTDIKFEQNDFFLKFQNKIFDKSIWCVAPNVILDNSKKPQNPFLYTRLKKNKVFMYKTIYNSIFLFVPFMLLAKIKNKLITIQNSKIYLKNIYAAHGSGLFLHKKCIQELVKNNDPIFMYGEEVLIAEIIYENCKKVYYYDEIKFQHYANKVTSLLKSKMVQKFFSDSFNYIYKRFY